ncbi:hypothetical protein ACUTAF_08240 [Pseudomonas sp. SP16.1]|uniref:hypothetical protein n=1 Tax=Pseudomonas sp. SP16.1 TaxID=3458854 RepID=UPI0040461D38
MTLPVWGVPWHGLVRGGQLQLPNGTTRSYRQPSPVQFSVGSTLITPQDTHGITHRHAAGMPPVVRSEDEAAADLAAGRQWRNEATLSGGIIQLHTKQIAGWIYVDPNGERWLVRCTNLDEGPFRNFTAPLAITVSLRRFGRWQQPGALYSYSLSLTFGDVGPLTSGNVMIDAIAPDGSKAIILAFGRSTGRRMGRQARSFIELRIAGPGAAATITSAVVREFDDINKASPPLPSHLWYLGTDGIYYPALPPGGFYEVAALECVAAGTRTFERLCALWYDAAGVLQEVSMRQVLAFEYNAPRPPTYEPPDTPSPYSLTSTCSGELQIVVAGVVRHAVSISASMVASQVPGSTYRSGTFNYEHSVTIDGVTLTGAASEFKGDTDGAAFPELGRLGLSGTSDVALVGAEWGAFPGLEPALNPVGGTATLYRARADLYWYSRQVVGFEISTENGDGDNPASRRWRNHPPVTPSGPAAGSVQVLAAATPPPYYGSHDPYTGAVSWYQLNPVCYV